MRWPKHIKATPRAGGLRLIPGRAELHPLIESFYPWDQVGQVHSNGAGSIWCVYDEEGQELRFNRRRLYLDINSNRAALLAERAQRRHFQRSWRDGSLQVTEVFEPHPRCCFALWGLACLGLLIGLYKLLPILVHSLQTAQALHLSIGHQVLSVIAMLSTPLIGVVLLAVLIVLEVRMLRLDVARASYDSRGIDVELRDGTRIVQAWDSLVSISAPRGISRLTFQDGRSFSLLLSKRSRLLAERLANLLDAQYPAREQRRQRHVMLRIWTYWLTAIAAGAIGLWLSRDPSAPPPGILPFVLQVGLITLLGAGFTLTLWFRNRRQSKWTVSRV